MKIIEKGDKHITHHATKKTTLLFKSNRLHNLLSRGENKDISKLGHYIVIAIPSPQEVKDI